MTRHFKTADGCERWEPNAVDTPMLLRVPIRYTKVGGEFSPSATWYAYRLYRMVWFERDKGLVHYEEVYCDS